MGVSGPVETSNGADARQPEAPTPLVSPSGSIDPPARAMAWWPSVLTRPPLDGGRLLPKGRGRLTEKAFGVKPECAAHAQWPCCGCGPELLAVRTPHGVTLNPKAHILNRMHREQN